MGTVAHQGAVALYEQLLRAWNEQNADAFGAVFAEDGSAVGFDGSTMNGRQEIVATLRGIFEHHRTATYVAKVREVRQLGADVVLVRAVVGRARAFAWRCFTTHQRRFTAGRNSPRISRAS